MLVKRPYSHLPVTNAPSGVNDALREIAQMLRALNEASAVGQVYYGGYPVATGVPLTNTMAALPVLNTRGPEDGVSLDSAGSRLIVQRRGVYTASFSVTANAAVPGSQLSVRVNAVNSTLQSVGGPAYAATGVLALQAGDVVDLGARAAPNATLNVTTASLTLVQVV